MARADGGRRAWAWLVAALVPAAVVAAEPGPTAPPPPEPGLLEFLAEEPQTDDELGEALLARDVEKVMQRGGKDRKVRDDDQDPA